MNQNPLIQSCFTMQMCFYQTLQNMLIITCSTNFQGAINTYQNFFQLFSRKVSVHINCSTSWLPLLSQLPRPPALWSPLLEASSPRWGAPQVPRARRGGELGYRPQSHCPVRSELQHPPAQAGSSGSTGKEGIVDQASDIRRAGNDQCRVHPVQPLFLDNTYLHLAIQLS